MTHGQAIDLIRNAGREVFLSYEETVAIYLRARGILNDGAAELGAPVPEDWSPFSGFKHPETCPCTDCT